MPLKYLRDRGILVIIGIILSILMISQVSDYFYTLYVEHELRIKENAELNIYGDIEYLDTYWDDLRVPANNTRVNPANSEPAYESFIGNVFAYHFDPANNNDYSLHFIVQLPHERKEGSDLEPHIHWSPKTTNSNNVVWEFEYVGVSVNGTFGTVTHDTITVATGGVANVHKLSSFSTIEGSSLGLSSILVCAVTRLGDELTDNFTGDAVFFEFDFHYEIDKPGSTQETTY